MKEPQPKHREIVKEHLFTEELRKLISHARRADEFMEAVEWALSRNPRIGIAIGKSRVYFLPIAESPVVDPIILYYTFDDDHVYFLLIRRTHYPPKENEQ